MVKSASRFILPLLLAVLAVPVHAADFFAEVDRTELYANEHAMLTLSLSGSDTRLRAEGVSPNVDLTVLDSDFEFGNPRAEFRFNTARARGRATSSVTVELFPRRAGNLRIPAFTVDGLSTEPITLRVLPLPVDARPEVFVRSGVARDRLHVGEQTLLWLDLYHRVDLTGARLGGPLESHPRELEAHALPATERSERVGGIDYRVTRTAWAVSPLRAGELILTLPEVRTETRQGRQWRLPFSEQRIEVIPLPAGMTDPLIGRPELRVTLPDTLRAGEPAAWEIMLRSRSALNRLPATAPLVDPVAGLRSYMDPPERRIEVEDGDVVSVAVYRGHLLAETAGAMLSPALKQAYYEPADALLSAVEVAGRPLRAEPPVRSEDEARLLTPSAEVPERIADSAHEDRAVPWRTVALVLAAAWLTTLVAWYRVSRRRGTPRESRSGRDDPSRRLLTMLGGARTLEEGLDGWEQRHGSDEAVRRAIRKVQRLRYRPGELAATEREAALREAIDAALALLSARAEQAPRHPREAPDDPWSPQAFRLPPQAAADESR